MFNVAFCVVTLTPPIEPTAPAIEFELSTYSYLLNVLYFKSSNWTVATGAVSLSLPYIFTRAELLIVVVPKNVAHVSVDTGL